MDMPVKHDLVAISAAFPDAALTVDNTGLENWSRRFAGRDAESSEREIDSITADALEQWRLDDAIFWQRVKLRARRLRAVARTGDDAPARDSATRPR